MTLYPKPVVMVTTFTEHTRSMPLFEATSVTIAYPNW